MNRTIRAGILGFGVAGRSFHAPLLRAAGIEVAAVVSRQRDLIERALPAALVLATDTDLFARADIDLVVIATPHHLHAAQARAALAAGKHVVVDKPMAVHADECDALLGLAHRERRMLSVFHNRRWDSDFRTIQQLVADGALGGLTAFQARWDRFRPLVSDRWREDDSPGSGIVYDLGTHLIDQVLVLLGMPDWVQAHVAVQRPGARTSDAFSIQMIARNVPITLAASMLVADGGPRYAVHGAKGSYVKFGLDVQEAQLRADASPLDAEFGVEPRSQWGRLTDGATGASQPIPSERGCWTEFYKSVRAAIETGGAPPVSGESGRDVIRVVEAALRSSESGRRVVP